MALEDHVRQSDIDRLNKLPAWAATIIRKLAMTIDMLNCDIGDAKAALSAATGAGDDKTTTWVEQEGGNLPIGINPDVGHRLACGDKLDVHFGTSGLEVSSVSLGGLAVLPITTYEIKVIPR